MTLLRVGVVSAHYPPNFVSGGTVLPQRLARTLAGRGHYVHVLAGWMGKGRTPLQVWDEVDETGLPIRWLNVGPYLAWHDPRNFDNAPARDAVARWLADTSPDVVHVHSLQGLGALVPAAAKFAGARVVVTMHDFWWVCARQFLADPDLRACGPTVTASACSCEVTRDWADARLAFCLAQLEHVDAVLTPSASAARILVANGVREDRLRVDPNGYETPQLIRADDPRSGVRFTYTGGANPLKGVGVLLAAARRLEAIPGWRLRIHGVEAADFGSQSHVETAPAFPSEQLPAVLGATDVLVVPSLAQETSSLTVLEALAAGVPVIASATPGPSDVISDGLNGLLVPVGDERALAGAMRRLVVQSDLLARLKTGCTEGPPAPRSVADQAAGHEQLYEALLAPTSRALPIKPRIERVLFVVGIDGAPLRYRAHLPAEALALVGVRAEIRYYLHPDVAELADSADVVVVYRVPSTRQVLDLIGRLRRRGTPVLFDADDLIFDPVLVPELPAFARMAPDDAALYLLGVRRYRTTLEACDGFIASTEALATEATRLTGLATARFDNGVGRVLGRNSDRARRRPRKPGAVRIGYLSGTDTHADDWLAIQAVLVDALRRHRSVELWLGGLLPASPELERFGRRVKKLDWVHWARLPEVLRDLDVNLAPLTPGRFSEAKSAIKWLEAALTATPTVASATGAFRDAIDHGRTGWLAHDAAEWAEGLDRLLADDESRVEMGRQARETALLRWSPHRQARRYLGLLEQAFAWRRSGAAAVVGPDLAPDEPPSRLELEPYGLEQTVDGELGAPSRRARRSWSHRVEPAQRASAYAARLIQRSVRR